MPAKSPKVLVVDDEPQIRTLLKATLTRAGYAVVEAASGREALNAKSIDKPDLVLLDLGLPDRDGLELVTLLRQEPRAALIVVSARDQTEQKVAALDLGADDYVTKPFDTEELLARVRASLRQRLASEAERQVVQNEYLRVAIRALRQKLEDTQSQPQLIINEPGVGYRLIAR